MFMVEKEPSSPKQKPNRQTCSLYIKSWFAQTEDMHVNTGNIALIKTRLTNITKQCTEHLKLKENLVYNLHRGRSERD